MVKAITLEFRSIQLHCIRNILVKFGIFNSPQSPDIGQNPDGGISDFRISGQSLIKENFHNSRTTDDINMKLVPVTKLGKRNKTLPKKFDDDFISENYDVIVIFPIYHQFGAIQKLDSGSIVYKTYIFIDNTFCLTKAETELKYF